MHLPLCNIEQISFGCDGGAGVRGSSIERNHPGSWAVSELLLASDEVCVVLFFVFADCGSIAFIYFLNVMQGIKQSMNRESQKSCKNTIKHKNIPLIRHRRL